MKSNPFDTKEGRKYVKMKYEQILRLPKPRPLKEVLKLWKKSYKEKGKKDEMD